MTQITGDIRIDPLRAALLELGERRRTILWLTRLVRVAWVWGAALLCVLLLDAIVALPPEGRLACDVLLLAGIPAGLLLTRTRPGDARRGPLRDARRLETHHELAHNPLVNGLLLSPLSRHDDPLVGALAGRTHERAMDVVERVDRQVVIDRRALRRQFVYAALVGLTWVATLLAAPGVIGTGFARLLMPFEDVPPFSFTTLELTAEPGEPYVGDHVALIARVSGEPATRVELVELDADLRELQRWPMSAGKSGFVRTLRSVSEPMIVQAEANGARSKRLHLTPRPRPVESEAAANEPDKAEEAAPQPRVMKQIPRPVFDLAKEFPEIHEKVRQLQQMAQEIGQMQQALAAMVPQSPQFQQQLAELESKLASFRELSAEAAGMCRAAAQAEDTTQLQRDKLEALAEALESLSMCKLGSCPNPGIGFGKGQGFGGGGLVGSPFGNWMTGLQMAQASDVSFMSQMLREMGFADSPYGDAGPRDAHATALPGDPDPAVGGEYAERYDEVVEAGTRPDRATMQRVPPAYRPLVRRYYERLADDERSEP